MNKIAKLSTLFLVILPLVARGQGDYYENIGKIYVVVAVAAILIIGISVFLLYLDRRITKLEKQIQDDNRSE